MIAPLMRMGLIGFANEQQLNAMLTARSRIVRWTLSPAADADAFWVNGSRAQMIRDGMVRIPAMDVTRRATVLNLKEVDRPIAFTLPLHPQATFVPALTFDLHNAESIFAVMKSFESQLQILALELAIAHQLAARRHEMHSPVFHLILRGSLVGVVVLGGAVGFAPTLASADIVDIEWSGRPESAGLMSPHFVQTTMASMMWQYTGRTEEDLLPQRYKESRIYFRRIPSVHQRLLRDIHLLAISELRTKPQTYNQLRASTGMTQQQVSQALAALYFAGAITTDSRKAMAPMSGSAEHASSDLNTSILEDEAGPAPLIPPRPRRRAAESGPSTVPTPLEVPQKK